MKRYILIFAVLLALIGQAHAYIPTTSLWSLIDAYRAIAENYVDPLQETDLTQHAIKGILNQLDPHSTYIPADDVAQANETIDGNFEGIGISYQMIEDTLTVMQVISGCPAEKVGVLPGDKVLSVNDTTIAGVKMTNTKIAKLIRGPRGTEVHITVKRANTNGLIQFIIIRDRIPVNTLDAAYRIDDKTIYILLNSFGRNTMNEITRACDSLKLWQANNVILDLQDNGGGLLQTSLQLADEFLPQGRLIVYTEGDKQPRRNDYATISGRWENVNLYILVNEYTASASEIVSGAVQDNDRGLIIGRRTFGKGLVQRPIPLRDGSVIRLTVARYYTPSGRCIQKPYSKGNIAYQEDILERYKHGELENPDSIKFPDSLRYETLHLHRTIYGGGGIMPDIFIPYDTNRFTTYHRDLVAKGVVNKVVVRYVLANTKSIKKKYSTFDNYNRQFTVPESLLKEIISEGETLDITYNDEQFQKSKPLLSMQIKAIVARNVFSNSDYFKVMNEVNEPLLKALEIIRTNQLPNYLRNKRK